MIQRSGIYQIVNSENGKRYVGSAKNFHVRSSKHSSSLGLGKHHSKHLQAAFIKYGADKFEFKILLVCAPEDLLFYEQRAIDTLKPEYNMSPTAGNTLGTPCSAEKRAKISASHTGKVRTPEHRAAIALGGIGRIPTDEARVNLRAAARLKAADPEWRKKLSEGKIGKPLSEAHRKKLSDMRKGVPATLSEEGRLRKNRKISDANRVRPISDAMRLNCSEAQKNRSDVARYSYRGESKTLLQLSEICGLLKVTIRHRVVHLGWSVERAVDTPSRKAK
jgi:group I intron endonuclease